VLTGRTGGEASALKDGDKQGKVSRFEVAEVKVLKKSVNSRCKSV